MPPGWTLDAGAYRVRIVRRGDLSAADEGRRLPVPRVAALLPRWLAEPSSRTTLLNAYASVGLAPVVPAERTSPERVTRIWQARLERAFGHGDLVALREDAVAPVPVGGREAAAEAPPAAAPPPAREKKYALVFKKPRDGDVFLVGDKAEVEAVVTEDGAETKREVTYGGSVEKQLYLLDSPGAHTITGSNSEVGVSGEVKIRAVRPWIAKVQSDGPGVYPVHDPKSGAEKKGLIETDLYDPKPKVLVPTSAKMGTHVQLRLTIQGSESLTDPAEMEVAVTSPEPCDDTETDFKSEGFANKPIHWKGKTTVSKLNEDKLEAKPDRPVPKRICRFLWQTPWTYRVKWPDGKWSHPDEDPAKWRPLGGPREFFLYGVWNAPKKGGPFTLKHKQYDHFHIDKACLFGEGAFHLKLCGKWSIPFKVDNRMGHLSWPDDYRFFAGNDPAKPDAKPANYNRLSSHPAGLHYADLDSPAMKDFNWGWAVLDNPRGAGGRCNQQAALIAAILNTLGIDAKARHLTSRWGTGGNGVIDAGHDNHDPVTMGAPCFDGDPDSWSRDIGWNFHGICLVNTEGAESEETQYDGSFSSPYTGSWDGVPECEDDHLFGSRTGRKHGPKSIATVTTHDLRPWAERDGDRCRCGHEMPSAEKKCPGTEKPDPKGVPVKTPCGAQPSYRYMCAKCSTGRLSRSESRCPSCRRKLKGMYSECLISLCSCGSTVHDSMTACWACGAALPPVSYLED